jgi:hypothetical protein
MGLCTNLRAIIPRALTSTCFCFVAFKTPFPSISTPNASMIVLQRKKKRLKLLLGQLKFLPKEVIVPCEKWFELLSRKTMNLP